ncbi:MAG: hypothetical protein KGJ90_06900 [Patescibacteria group bacterium]|nr:hypothetical protein [Patescibacteria group bacterium]
MSRYVRTPDALRRAKDLLLYAVSRKTSLITSPAWVYEEKKLAALAVARLDRILGIKSVWGLTQDVINCYPTLASELKELGADVRFHYHIKPDPKGEATPVWNPPLEGIGDKLFDSHWPRSLEGDYCVWHIDYFYSNAQWLKYLEFLEEYLRESR